MDANTWARVKDIFSGVVELSAEERGRSLDAICNGDRELREEVEALLSSNDKVEDFIEEPAFNLTDALTAESGPAAGKSIGKYRVIREIGRGGMGTVFLAARDDGEFQHEVAIKVVSSAFLGRESVERFRQERQILAHLSHPNIARLLDGGVTDEGLPYLVMEHVAGDTVTAYADRNGLSIDDCLRLFVKICRAFAYAHGNLIVHRDVKPQNILITTDGEPKLLDFGLAKILDIENIDTRTATNFRALTPAYASPEQLRGDAISTGSDIYSLGIVLYELLTGARPFNYGSANLEKMIELAAVSNAEKPSSKVMRSDASDRNGGDTGGSTADRGRFLRGDVDNIVLMAMRKEPDRRYRSADHLAEDIERHLDGLTIAATEDTFVYRTRKFIQRHKAAVAAVCVVFIAIAAGLAVSISQARIAREQRDIAREEKAKADRINHFLQSMLSYSNQSWTATAGPARGRDVTINEMLDDIAPQIETELAAQPEVQAQLFRTIAAAYNSQARYDLAERYVRMAIEIQRRIHGEDHPEVLTSMGVLGETLYQTSQFDEGDIMFVRLIASLRERSAQGLTVPSVTSLPAALNGLATMRFFKGDTGSAIELNREALAAASGLGLTGKERGLIAEIQLNLGAFIMAAGDLDESEGLLRASMAEFKALPGDPRWEMGVSYTKLGECLVYKKQIDEANTLLSEGEAIYRNTLGDQNSYLVRNLSYQALAALEKNDVAGAVEISGRALEIVELASLRSSSVHARILYTLGKAQCKTGRSGEGKLTLRESLAMFDRDPRRNEKHVIEAASALSECVQ